MIMNVHEAKTHLSQLLKQVALGDTVVIARDGVPVAQLVPIVGTQTARVPGLGKGTWIVAEDWDSPETNAQVAALFLGEDLDKENAKDQVARKPKKAKMASKKQKVTR